MKRLSLISVILVFVAWFAVPTANADIEVAPMPYDFGDVELGTSDTVIITITNVPGVVFEPLAIYNVTLQPGCDPDFSISMSPSFPLYLDPGSPQKLKSPFHRLPRGIIYVSYWSKVMTPCIPKYT